MRAMQTKLTQGLEALPPFGILIVLALQHVLLPIVDLAIPVLVARAMSGSPAQIPWMV